MACSECMQRLYYLYTLVPGPNNTPSASKVTLQEKERCIANMYFLLLFFHLCDGPECVSQVKMKRNNAKAVQIPQDTGQ